MKKKTLIIIAIILILFKLITSYKDSARVRNGIEPKYTIKIISRNGRKVTYWGLGYKIIRYVGVSPNEPFGLNDNYKYGSWFMKYDLKENVKLDIEEVNDFITNYLENNNYSNLSYHYIDEEMGKVIVGLNDNSKEKQEKFIFDVFTNCCGSKTIKAIEENNIIIFE